MNRVELLKYMSIDEQERYNLDTISKETIDIERKERAGYWSRDI